MEHGSNTETLIRVMSVFHPWLFVFILSFAVDSIDQHPQAAQVFAVEDEAQARQRGQVRIVGFGRQGRGRLEGAGFHNVGELSPDFFQQRLWQSVLETQDEMMIDILRRLEQQHGEIIARMTAEPKPAPSA